MRVVCVGLYVALGAAPAFAQTSEADPNDFTYVVETFDQVSVHPGPPWLSETPAQSPAGAQQGETAPGQQALIHEWVPNGQTLEAWTELYALFAERPLPGGLDGYRNGLLQAYDGGCSATGLKQYVTRPDQELFTVFCSAYRDQPTTGEIAVFHYRKVGETLVRVYYQRRVPAFTLDVPPPIDALELLGLKDWLGQFRLIPISQ